MRWLLRCVNLVDKRGSTEEYKVLEVMAPLADVAFRALQWKRQYAEAENCSRLWINIIYRW